MTPSHFNSFSIGATMRRLGMLCMLGIVMLVAHAEQTIDPRTLVAPELSAWIKPPLEVEPSATGPTSSGGSTPLRMLLVEEQTDVAGAEEFYHYAYRIETEAGLQQAGQVSVGFAPGYQTLQWHFLRIWRDGESRAALDPAALQVLRQEENAERFLYHGRMTALIILHDLRVGDVVETAYTHKGRNPVFAGRFSTTLAGASSTPIDRLYYRIREEPGRALQIAPVGDFKPVHHVEEVEGRVEHTWAAQGIQAVNFLADAPALEPQYPYVQITDYASWSEVRDWARTLFADNLKLTPELMARVEAITALFKTQDEKAEALLRFVQDDIRYLGIHLNESTHRPKPPMEVLEGRFGDCKDKALLLVALLREIGIGADVALVSATRQKGLLQLQPSPLSFDHAIVRVRYERAAKRAPSLAPIRLSAIPPAFSTDTPLFNADEDGLSLNISSGPSFLWLDPTMTLQGGAFTRRNVPEYGYALVLSDTEDRLVKVESPASAAGAIEVKETYIMTDVTTPAQMAVVSTYRGAMADNYRYLRRVVEPARYTQQLTGYLARFYPKIKAIGSVEWADDREANVLTAHSLFDVPDFWVTDAQARFRKVEVFPWTFLERLPRPETTDRTFSFTLPYPLTITHRSELILPKNWPDSDDHLEIKDGTFTFDHEAHTKGRYANVSYRWQTRADAVPADRLADWIKKMSEVRATFGYQLQQNIRLANATKQDGIVWPLAGSGIAGGVVGIVVGCMLYRWRPQSASLPPPLGCSHLAGIAGGLTLVAIGVVLRPLMLLTRAKDLLGLMGNLPVWIARTDAESVSYLPGYASFASCEAFMLPALMAWSLVMAVQFFRRKASLPVSLIILLVLTCGWTAARSYWLRQIDSSVGNEGVTRVVTTIVFQVVLSALWVAYLVVSRRVKATFRA